MRTLEAWQIDHLNREREERERQYERSRPSIQLPMPERRPLQPKPAEESERGVCVIDYSL